MRYSKLFGKTLREAPKEARLPSHKLLYQAGFIRESTAGRYYFLPLGWRVHQKIAAIIKEEMDATGAQEMITPVLHPLALWQETNRTTSMGFELMTIKDGREFQFALGGTAEEMFVDLVRKFKLSYKDLPFNVYQFSTKFRDELRARGGLLRVREFVMKDAYSFDRSEAEFKKVYEQMGKTYQRIFERMGLATIKVEADNGYIGGEYCHEFQMESENGEGRFFVGGKYAAHADVARFTREEKNVDEAVQPYKEIEAARETTMEDGVKLHGLPLWQQIKDVMMTDEKGNLILAVIRGDLTVNEVKLAHLAGAAQLRHATDEEIRKIGSEPGFISPVGLKGKVKIIGDISLRTIRNAYGGANKKYVDAVNMNLDRDYQLDLEGDIAMCEEGFLSEEGSVLHEKRGIEVGNIFQLGYHYTKLMKGAVFVDEDGQEKPYYMGCYGIGIGRTMAAIVEQYHDDKGIVWPAAVAPFQAQLTVISNQLSVIRQADQVYDRLVEVGIEVLYDDREESAGVKFADADLIGMPVRLVVSAKTGDKVEWKRRDSDKTELLTVDEVVRRVVEWDYD